MVRTLSFVWMQLAHGMNNEFANKGQNAWRILIEVAIKVVNPKYSKKYAMALEMSFVCSSLFWY